MFSQTQNTQTHSDKDCAPQTVWALAQLELQPANVCDLLTNRTMIIVTPLSDTSITDSVWKDK